MREGFAAITDVLLQSIDHSCKIICNQRALLFKNYLYGIKLCLHSFQLCVQYGIDGVIEGLQSFILQTLLLIVIDMLGIHGIIKQLEDSCFKGTGIYLAVCCQSNGIMTLIQFSTKLINLILQSIQALIKL